MKFSNYTGTKSLALTLFHLMAFILYSLQSCTEAGKEETASPSNTTRHTFISDKVLRGRENKPASYSAMFVANCWQGTESWCWQGEIQIMIVSLLLPHSDSPISRKIL